MQLRGCRRISDQIFICNCINYTVYKKDLEGITKGNRDAFRRESEIIVWQMCLKQMLDPKREEETAQD